MYAKPIYVIDGARTPFLKAKNRPGAFSAGDLATQAGKTLLARQKFAPQELDEVSLGCAEPVDHAAHRQGQDQRHHGRQDQCRHCQGDAPPVGLQERHQAPQRAHLARRRPLFRPLAVARHARPLIFRAGLGYARAVGKRRDCRAPFAVPPCPSEVA